MELLGVSSPSKLDKGELRQYVIGLLRQLELSKRLSKRDNQSRFRSA